MLYDSARGLDFLSVIHPRELGLDEEVAFRGSPSGNKFLLTLLSEMKIKETDRILDIGCSKGDAIRCMLKFQFHFVDGLEISQRLSKIAKENFEKLNKRNVQIFNVDARYFSNYKDYNFFYLYNPFPEVVMSDVLSKLSKIAYNNEVIIIYNNPVCHKLVEDAGFKKYKEYPDQWGNGIFVYSNKLSNCRFFEK